MGQGHHSHRLKRSKWASPFTPGHDVPLDEWLPKYVQWVMENMPQCLHQLQGVTWCATASTEACAKQTCSLAWCHRAVLADTFDRQRSAMGWAARPLEAPRQVRLRQRMAEGQEPEPLSHNPQPQFCRMASHNGRTFQPGRGTVGATNTDRGAAPAAAVCRALDRNRGHQTQAVSPPSGRASAGAEAQMGRSNLSFPQISA